MDLVEALQQTIDIQKQHYNDMKLFAHQAMSLLITQNSGPQLQPSVQEQEFEEELDSALKGGELD